MGSVLKLPCYENGAIFHFNVAQKGDEGWIMKVSHDYFIPEKQLFMNLLFSLLWKWHLSLSSFINFELFGTHPNQLPYPYKAYFFLVFIWHRLQAFFERPTAKRSVLPVYLLTYSPSKKHKDDFNLLARKSLTSPQLFTEWVA